MNAEIVTIGDEILIGQIVDTNSAWIASELNKVGVDVLRVTSISDRGEEIERIVNEVFNRVDILLVTGGLGPTSDDITKPTLAHLFNTTLAIHEPTLKHISDLFEARGLPLTESNKAQALLPVVCSVIPNALGTAPGMLFSQKGKILISMPGVPFEMMNMMTHHVLPWIKDRMGVSDVILHKTLQTFGLPESFLSDRLSDWEKTLPHYIKLAYLPSPASIRLRLSAKGADCALLKGDVDSAIRELQKIIPDVLFGSDDQTMASAVGALLKQIGATVCTAESCTGGTIAQMLTSTPGSSAYFLGSVVAYSNTVKQNLLDVSQNDVITHGAVSKEVVESMAYGALQKFNANFAVATSGVAGPDGGTKEKPVGTVWIAVASQNKVVSEVFRFGSNRERNILRSSISALNMLRLLLFEENPLLRETFFSKMFD